MRGGSRSHPRSEAVPDEAEPPISHKDLPLAQAGSNAIETLPFDILYEIALYLVAEAWEADGRTNAPLYLSHTCRSLRTFTINAPILWSRIYFTKPRPKFPTFSEQDLWLQRSQGAPLHITIQQADSLGFSKKALSAIVKLLLPHIERWRSFKVMDVGYKGYRVIFDKLRHTTAPGLDTLTAPIPFTTTKWKFTPFTGGAPNLRSLSISPYVAVQLASEGNHMWPGLRYLEITSPAEYVPIWTSVPARAPRITHILDILRRYDKLQEFHVTYRDMLIPKNYRAPSLTHVPELRSLTLASHDWRENASLQEEVLANLNAPRLAQTGSPLMLSPHNIPILLSHPSFPLPNLRSVSLDKDAPDHASVCHILIKFSNLRAITFTNLAPDAVPPFIRLFSASLPLLEAISLGHLESAKNVSDFRPMAQARIDDPTLTPLVTLNITLVMLNITLAKADESDRAWLRANIPHCNITQNDIFGWSSSISATPSEESLDSPVIEGAEDPPQSPAIATTLDLGVPEPIPDTSDHHTSDHHTPDHHTPDHPISENHSPSPIPARRRYRKARQKRNRKKAARILAGLPVVRSPPGRSTYARRRRVPWRPRRATPIDNLSPSEPQGDGCVVMGQPEPVLSGV